jgi:hypothetical protein
MNILKNIVIFLQNTNILSVKFINLCKNLKNINIEYHVYLKFK